jgi:hypothetical protein
LSYAIAPATVAVSSTQSLTLTVTNPSEKFSVTLNPGPTSISVQNLTQLTATPGDITPVAPPGTPWQAGLADGSSGKYIKIWVTAPVVLAPQQSIAFRLDGIKVVDLPGTASLAVVEFIGGARATAPPIQVGLMAAALQIVAIARPVTVGLGEQTTLQWTIVQGAYVTVVPPDDGAQYPRKGPGWYSDSIRVQPYQDERQTTYTLTVYQDQSHFETASLVIDLSPPQILAFEADAAADLKVDQPVTVSWQVRYAQQVTLTPSKGPGFVPPEDQRTITPGSDAYLTGNTSQVTLTLTANGFKGPIVRRLPFQFAPMRIACFRYPDFDERTSYIYDVFNQRRVTVQPGGMAGAFTLTATGPGGPLTQELGGGGVEVQVLLADPPQVAPGGSCTLRYRVQHAASLTLLPGGQPLGFDGQGLGSVVVSPSATTTYTLRAKSGSAQVDSDLTVTVIG